MTLTSRQGGDSNARVAQATSRRYTGGCLVCTQATRRGRGPPAHALRARHRSAECEEGGDPRAPGLETQGHVTPTVKKTPLRGSGYSGYPPGMVPGMRKCRITRHSGCFLTVVLKFSFCTTHDRTLAHHHCGSRSLARPGRTAASLPPICPPAPRPPPSRRCFNEADHEGFQARLHRAGDRLKAVAEALLQNVAQISATDAQLGYTPLHFAVTSTKPAIVAALLAAGARPDAPDRFVRRPSHATCTRPH